MESFSKTVFRDLYFWGTPNLEFSTWLWFKPCKAVEILLAKKGHPDSLVSHSNALPCLFKNSVRFWFFPNRWNLSMPLAMLKNDQDIVRAFSLLKRHIVRTVINSSFLPPNSNTHFLFSTSATLWNMLYWIMKVWFRPKETTKKYFSFNKEAVHTTRIAIFLMVVLFSFKNGKIAWFPLN